MISAEGYVKYCIWEHSAHIRELYARRCRDEEEEMTCAAQAADLLGPLVAPGDTVLDVGCGSGYFYHSIRKRALPVEYVGIDASPSLIEIGRTYLPGFGLPAAHLRAVRIEDLDGEVEHIVCMNVLSNVDNYHRPLERLLECASKSVILRESCGERGSYSYVTDPFLDDGVALKVHVNTYPIEEWTTFIEAHGFQVERITDRRTRGAAELVIGHPHHWTFFVATREQGSRGRLNRR